MVDLKDKVGLITGGTSGIGRETALLFAKSGAKVVVAGRREAEGERTVEMIREAEGEGVFVKTDVSKASEVEALIQRTVDQFGRLDLAFNNAGVEGAWGPIIRQSEEDFDRTISINLKGVWLCLKYEMKQMIRQGGGGAIVNMSSVMGLVGSAGISGYTASKHGVVGLTRTAALECVKQGIRVNAVCPGFIGTPMSERALRVPTVHQHIVNSHPIGRLGKASEVAEAVVWMCSDAASFMTGQCLTIDGGYLAGQGPEKVSLSLD